MKKFCLVIVCGIFLFTTACATIVGDKTQLIGIKSTPEQASIEVTDEKGNSLFKGKTPTTVTLEKSDGTYFGGKNYSVRISKKGYETQSVQVSSQANGWYIAGNLVFGGLIGWLIVDPLTGAMYNLTPDEITTNLHQKAAKHNEITKDSISVVLLEDVPSNLRNKMVKIN